MGVGSTLSGLAGALAGRLKKVAADRVVDKFDIKEDATRNMSSFLKLSGETAGGFPTELLSLGASMWSGFILTPFAQQQMAGWVLPYWLRKQTDPSSVSFIPHGHAYFLANVTHRNWTGVGLSDFPNEGTVDPRGLVTPWPFAPSVDLWVMREGETVFPSELEAVSQGLLDDFPLVETSFEALGLSCTWTTFVAPLDTMPVLLSIAEVVNPGSDAVEAGFAVSVRPYNNESIRAINDLAYDPGSQCFIADGNLLVYLPEKPDEVVLSDYIHGDVSMLLSNSSRERFPGGTTRVEEPVGLATGAALYRREVSAGGSTTICFACPLTAGVRPEFKKMLPSENAGGLVSEKIAEQRRYWADISSLGMRVKIPEESYQKAFDINKTFLLMLYDGQSITPGASTYHMMWFRDAAYLVPALERMGHLDEARRILASYPDRQTPEGFFRSHTGEWDSNGQAMWTLVHHYLMTSDRDFLKGVYPSLMKGARWIDSTRRMDLPVSDPKHGLLPPGISAEHFGLADCYYWDDLWAVGGLNAAAWAAGELGCDGDARYLERLADDLWRDIGASLVMAQKRLGRKVMPIAPLRDVDAASIGMLAAVYPLDLIPADEEAMSNTVEEIIAKCFYRNTHFHGLFHCGLNPYLSMHVSQYFLRRRDPRGLAIFESLWPMATDTYTYPEAINPLTGGGAYGDGHDGWAAGDIFNFMRNLLVLEEDDTLVLLGLCKREWFAEGETIEVENAPTYFGEVSYSVRSSADRIEFALPGEFERSPSAVELNVPFPVVSCEIDGRKHGAPESGNGIKVPPTAKAVILGIKRNDDGS